ncbi:lipopolysaccharide assembly protein LapA domain-containing protein [Pseudomonas sp. Irchel 3E13]|uniref:lipopolysaccharide assembly protein LapA domain-containing protein n=1 Tax=Pseudomonas sp. Irchel 3E13 TaxID=2008975 RepID=UPI000BA2DD4D|nr:lipopolysaccharide assembly protein LapA domain-containing protein [Pseudomonas sp. Irchel 3E13]
MRNIRRLLLVLFVISLAALALFFVLENQQSVVLVFFGWTAPAVPVAALVLAALVAGLAVGPLLGGLIVLKARRGLS